MKRTLPEETDNMACEICLVKFSFFKKRKPCVECHGECCAACLVKEQGKHTCKRCCVLLAVPPDPSALMRLKVKDLKQYLGRKHISHQGCTEKDELVELVLQVALSASRSRSVPPSPPPPIPAEPPRRITPERASSSTLQNSSEPSAGDQNSASSSNGHRQSFFYPPQPSETDFNHHQTPQSAGSQENISETQPSSENQGIKPDDLLTSLENEEAIHALTVRQLKLLLARHFVDYKGCCEKAELQERVRRLWRQHRETKDIDPDTLSSEQLCKICWELPINCVLLECGHMATCTECGKQMNQCPICRQYVVRVVHTFRA